MTKPCFKKASAPNVERMNHPSSPMEISARKWKEIRSALTKGADLALLLIAGRQPPSIITSNNNSICHTLQSSPQHAHLCEPYCGRAYERAYAAEMATHYRCHAGLHCFAMPVEIEQRQLAVIGGRTFLSSADYRALAERVRIGDLKDLPVAELFQNVIFTQPENLDQLAARVTVAVSELNESGEVEMVSAVEERVEIPKHASTEQKPVKELSKLQINFPPGIALKDACRRAMQLLVETYDIAAIALLLRLDDSFTPVYTVGEFGAHPLRIALKAKTEKTFSDNVRRRDDMRELSIEVGNQEALRIEWDGEISESQTGIFPLTIGDETKGALVVAVNDTLTDELHRALSNFSREFAMPLEVLRLREELEHRIRATYHLQSFIERVNTVEPADAYVAILRHLTDLLHAERGSLLLFDEETKQLEVKAAVGPRAEITRKTRLALDDRGVSSTVLREGRPLVVRDIQASGRAPASSERLYKTASFISYPIINNGRSVGVLNVTDKTGGGAYTEKDVNLLDMIAPQMALALDRAGWHQKATQFQLLSITDPLTNLLNRRYLEERLAEELERSKRHRYAMCFMMIDIDDFKIYNDCNGHQAGDLALEMTAQTMKSALRSADVAARYGGEEFSVLLPQTSLAEAHVIAERIRRRVERTRYPLGKSQPLSAVTISIGISAFSPTLDTSRAVIGAADQALYVAKGLGKNRVEAYRSSFADSATQAPANKKSGDEK